MPRSLRKGPYTSEKLLKKIEGLKSDAKNVIKTWCRTMRYKGIRPTVRGTAMNAVDHPHGGGEGKTPIGLKYPKTPWGKIARGVKTRRREWTDKFIIQRRKKK